MQLYVFHFMLHGITDHVEIQIRRRKAVESKRYGAMQELTWEQQRLDRSFLFPEKEWKLYM